MARISRRAQALLAVVAVLVITASADTSLTDLPNLSTATETSDTSTTKASTASTTSATSATSDATTTAATTSATSTAASTDATTTGTSGTSVTTTSDASSSASTTVSGLLTDAPTIAGAGIPTLVIPYTADAPFMQKSSLPEGTVFIAVGAVLAFLGACVLLWRGLVAWSINSSVKRAAMASIRGTNEKQGSSYWGGSTAPSGGYNPAKGNLYKDAGSSMSLDHLTSAGKPIKSHFKDHDAGRASPPAGLFFSPTAQARSDAPGRPLSNIHDNTGNRGSSYLPAGYYASPSAQAAGGAGTTTLGGNLSPYAQRHSTYGAPSPPASPGLPPVSRGSARPQSTSAGLRPPSSREGPGGVSARSSYMDVRPGHGSGLYAQPSTSSLMVGLGQRPSDEGLSGSRAPSAYLEDLFENHGNGPRERF